MLYDQGIWVTLLVAPPPLLLSVVPINGFEFAMISCQAS